MTCEKTSLFRQGGQKSWLTSGFLIATFWLVPCIWMMLTSNTKESSTKCVYIAPKLEAYLRTAYLQYYFTSIIRLNSVLYSLVQYCRSQDIAVMWINDLCWLGHQSHFNLPTTALHVCNIITTIMINVLILVILTCQRRKSLRRTSPEVRMSRSGLGELLLYKHSFSNDSETSLGQQEGKISLKAVRVALRFRFDFPRRILNWCSLLAPPVYLAFSRPSSTPHAISLTALVISYLDV